mgnify:CR=1 FL=1|jgi:SPP1 gp7 family putative phage head morphogenesis protein
MLSKEREEEIRKELSSLFDGMMQTLYSLKGTQFRIEVLAKPKVQEFIDAHAEVLDSGFRQVEMSDAMRRRLMRSDYIFSGMKTFHELHEAFPSLLDENGNRKPFERFLNDVRKIDETYNSNYLRAEYNFVQSSAEMAVQWEQFIEDGDRYNLQYRTAHDGKVRPAHAALHGVTLPVTDSFWDEYYPPNGWNCRCTVVQVRKSKYPATPHDEAMALGEEALQRDSKGIFHFNAGKEQKTVPDYNPYTIRRCRDCDVAKGKLKLAKPFVPDNELCAVCKFLRSCNEHKRQKDFYDYKDKLIAKATQYEEKHDNLHTGRIYQTRKSFKRAIGHAWNIEEAEMYAKVKENIHNLLFERVSPLGEGKDINTQKDIANIDKKKKRGVTSYNIYKLILKNGEQWTVKTEVYKNRAETVYHIKRKE